MTEREQFLNTWEKEYPTTLKVLRAFPAARSDLKPHDRARDAKELAWTFAVEPGGNVGHHATSPYFVMTSITPPPCPVPHRIVASGPLTNRSARTTSMRMLRNASTGPRRTPSWYTSNWPAEGSRTLVMPRNRSHCGRNRAIASCASMAVILASSLSVIRSRGASVRVRVCPAEQAETRTANVSIVRMPVAPG